MGLFENYVLAKSLPEALSVIELGLADYVVSSKSAWLERD
jgi:hypothetical protein